MVSATCVTAACSFFFSLSVSDRRKCEKAQTFFTDRLWEWHIYGNLGVHKYVIFVCWVISKNVTLGCELWVLYFSSSTFTFYWHIRHKPKQFHFYARQLIKIGAFKTKIHFSYLTSTKIIRSSLFLIWGRYLYKMIGLLWLQTVFCFFESARGRPNTDIFFCTSVQLMLLSGLDGFWRIGESVDFKSRLLRRVDALICVVLLPHPKRLLSGNVLLRYIFVFIILWAVGG